MYRIGGAGLLIIRLSSARHIFTSAYVYIISISYMPLYVSHGRHFPMAEFVYIGYR